MPNLTIGSFLRGGANALALVLGTPLVMAASPAFAGGTLPASGHFVAGSGTIAKSGAGGLAIDQASHTGIIDWSSFSVGRKNSVQFNNGSGATLNRVTGGNLSTIAGSLKATGSLYLINPQGVIVSGSGKVIAGGSFVASSRDESDADFLGGKRRFAGSSKGNVVNAGSIRSVQGDVTLIGNSASNSGTLSATNGTASLNTGNQVLLAPAGSDGRILVKGGSGDVTNSGSIQSAQAQLNAAGGNVYALAGNNGGVIRATGTSTMNGHVWLTSSAGNVTVADTVAARNADGSGGVVGVRAAGIALTGRIDVSAHVQNRSGGTVGIIANNTATIGGKIAATGGARGKGGFVETSGRHLHVARSARIDTRAGVTGNWLIDPNDFTIAASGGDITGAALSTELNSTNVTISSDDGTASGHGDIFVNDFVNWATTSSLTLNAQGNIYVNAKIDDADLGALILNTGSGNRLIMAPDKGSITLSGNFSGNNTALTINGQAFTLLYSMADVQAINASSAALQGHYALAVPLSASSTTGWVPIGTDGAGSILNSGNGFSGTFEGLGNSISNLSINLPAVDYVGLFGDASGFIRDVGMIGGTVTGRTYVGDLAGISSSIIGSFATGTVNGADDTGGLSGVAGTITDSFATGAVNGGDTIGGLSGIGGTITNSYATGNVTGHDDVGGLTGMATVTDFSHATGTVIGNNNVGGLVGAIHTEWTLGDPENTPTTPLESISQSYATGSVKGGNYVGGLLGLNDQSVVETSYATGAVNGGYCTPSCGGPINVGGLVGFNQGEQQLIDGGPATITDAYATGRVSTLRSCCDSAGGLVGYNTGSITNAYATGQVVPKDPESGAFVGVEFHGPGTITNGYWNTQTSGQIVGYHYDTGGSNANGGMTTAQLQGSLPTGFSSGIWGTGAGLYPYFLWQYPSAPQAISGVVYRDAGKTPYTTSKVSALVNGVLLDSTWVGANGYYYMLAPADSLDGKNVLVYTRSNTTGNPNKANTYALGGSGSLVNTDLYGDYVRFISSANKLSSIYNGYNHALGDNSGDDFLFDGTTFTPGTSVDVESSYSGGLNIDQNIVVDTAAGNVILNAAGSIVETHTKKIVAYSLTGSAAGAASLETANRISKLDSFAATTGLSMVDNNDLGVVGNLNVISLATTGTGHDLVINGMLTGVNMWLETGGTIAEGASGKIVATTLYDVTAHGSISLPRDNRIGTILHMENLGSGGISFANTDTLRVAGNLTVNDAGGSLLLRIVSGDLVMNRDAVLTAPTITLVSGGSAAESSLGHITTNLINVTANTGINLLGQNHIKKVGTRKTNSGPNVIKGVGS